MFLKAFGDHVDFELLSFKGAAASFAILFASAVIYAVSTAVYNVWFHPLSHIPGPFFARASGFPYVYKTRKGDITKWIKQLHDQYGEVVRVAPKELSFISADTAWPDIYGFRTGKYKGTAVHMKDRDWYPKPVNGTWSIIGADEEAHTRMRRNLSHLFSEKALRQQETLFRGYIDLLVQRMKEHAEQGEAMDFVRWYNFTTFDIIADLAFGECLYCLRDCENHEWIDMVFASVAGGTTIMTRKKYALVRYYDRLRNIFQNKMQNEQGRIAFAHKASAKVQQRLDQLENGTDDTKPDFFGQIMRNQVAPEKRLSRAEMDCNAVLFLVAGSETTATTLSGFTYLMLTHPDAYTKLVKEIRTAFSSLSDINVEKAGDLEYMSACIQETLRMYPPTPTGLPRVTPKGGSTISGYYIPEGTSVYVSQHATYHSERNFKNPDTFVPERWLGASEYADDKREVWNPFSFGPRNCLGKNLAWAELRLIIACVFFSLDLELVEPERDWFAEQKVYTLWKKPELIVRVKVAQE